MLITQGLISERGMKEILCDIIAYNEWKVKEVQ